MVETVAAGRRCVSVIVGLVADNDKLTFNPSILLLHGSTWTSGLFGGYKEKTDLWFRC
jgi:Zn-dependent alcohol dehydrogenase